MQPTQPWCAIQALIITLLFFYPIPLHAKVWELNMKNFHEVINGESNVLLVFHSSDSAHSAKLQTEFEFMADEIFSEEDGVIFARVNCFTEPEFIDLYEIEGFPVLKWFSKGSTEPEPFYLVHYEGRLAKTLTKLVNERTGLRRVVPQERTPVNDITQTQWDANLSKTKYTVVLFVSPWCIECDVLKFNFVTAARAFESETDITFAQLDVKTIHERDIMQRYSVKKFPTIVFFQPDDEPQLVTKTISAEEIVDIVNDMANKYRTVKGGLKPEVCVVEELNKIILAHPRINEEVINHARSVFERLEGRERENGEHYIKIMEKIHETGPSYIQSEIKRLDKLLKSGSSAKNDKKTLFSVRRNILDIFKAAQENSVHSEL